MKTAQYLGALKARLKIESDYALAKALGVKPNRISNWRCGRNLPDAAMAVRLAELLEIEPLKVIADVELERGGTNDALWKRIRGAAAIAGAVIAGALLYSIVRDGSAFDIAWFSGALPMDGGALAFLSVISQEYTLCRVVIAAAAVLTITWWWILEASPRARSAL